MHSYLQVFYTGDFKHPFTLPGGLHFNPTSSRGTCNYGELEANSSQWGAGGATGAGGHKCGTGAQWLWCWRGVAEGEQDPADASEPLLNCAEPVLHLC